MKPKEEKKAENKTAAEKVKTPEPPQKKYPLGKEGKKPN
jgi:hypothetical protein